MGITYNEKERIFKLDTPKTSYVIGIVDQENFVGHVYYGRRLNDDALSYLLRTGEAPYVPSKNERDRTSFLDCFPMEYPGHGLGDFREDCLAVRDKHGCSAAGIFYTSHSITAGKPPLAGLPSVLGTKEACTTLELYCIDACLSLEVVLVYTVFHDLDIITRSVRVHNTGSGAVTLTKVMSASIDMDNQDYEMLSMTGSWARERGIQRTKLGYGTHSVQSKRGASSHQEHPFIALLEKHTTEDAGGIYGMHFVYSGNFTASASLSQFDSVRMMIGIHPEDFAWNLAAGETFQTPEAVLVYSAEGIGHMTRTLHDLYRRHLIRGRYKDQKRPILINNWEATYFDFTSEKLLAIAKEASRLGIEMLVMDDGWFGKRSSDNAALGDWVVNEEKIAGGLRQLVEQVKALGMRFGIWFEPEMVSPDSDLYRSHPDWAVGIPGRRPALCRGQYVLDFTRKEVRDALFESISKILKSADISYVKWDMNRQLTDIYSGLLEDGRQGEFFHRYMLGVYELQERLVTEFPDILLENCSGGGGRFDPGMLYYSPQIWCSDNTDAIERLTIQYGTAMLYPLSTIGAHVSDCPNHLTGRTAPFATRGYAALAGTFGYELDVTKLSEEDRAMIPLQTALYHKYQDLVREGDYYRIAVYSENQEYDCWQVVSKDKTETLVTFIQVRHRPNRKSLRIFLKGLEEDRVYQAEEGGEAYTGNLLMHAGFHIQRLWGDFQGKLIYFRNRGAGADEESNHTEYRKGTELI